MKKSLFCALIGPFVAAILATSSGCYTVQNTISDWQSAQAARVNAHRAWWRYRPDYLDQECPRDFGYGFRSGYADVSLGANGCPPTLAPRCYWNARNSECRTIAWFDGYSHGAIAAEADGSVGSGILTSNTIYGRWRRPVIPYPGRNRSGSAPGMSGEGNMLTPPRGIDDLDTIDPDLVPPPIPERATDLVPPPTYDSPRPSARRSHKGARPSDPRIATHDASRTSKTK
jgi:hypothetical protein